MTQKPKTIEALGYIKQTDGVFTAICVNMGLFGQGKTADEAVKKAIEAIGSYVSYIQAEHPKDWEKYVYRSVPPEMVKEFQDGLNVMMSMTSEGGESKRKKKSLTPRKPFLPVRNFVEEIPVS